MPKKILVVDDEESILEAVEIILTNAGFTVVTLPNVRSIRQIIAIQPDLILLDVLLAGRSGRSICSDITSNRATCDIPIIILSAHPMSTLKKLVEECGAKAFL